MSTNEESEPEPLTKQDFEALARFRFGIHRYLRFSEETVRHHDLTPQQYQLLLALKGFPGREWALVAELAERLQLRHHSVVELINRAQKQDLVRRVPHPDDARAVRIELTGHGQEILARLSALHRDELRRMGIDAYTAGLGGRMSGAARWVVVGIGGQAGGAGEVGGVADFEEDAGCGSDADAGHRGQDR